MAAVVARAMTASIASFFRIAFSLSGMGALGSGSRVPVHDSHKRKCKQLLLYLLPSWRVLTECQASSVQGAENLWSGLGGVLGGSKRFLRAISLWFFWL